MARGIGSYFFNYEKAAFTAAAPIFFVLVGFLGSVVFWGCFTMDQGPLDTYREFGVPLTGVVEQSVAATEAASGISDFDPDSGDYRRWPNLYVELDHPPADDKSQNDLAGVLVDTRTGSRLRSDDRVTVLRSDDRQDSVYAYILPGDMPPLRRHLEFLFAVAVLPFLLVEIFWAAVTAVHARRGFAISSRVGWLRMRSTGLAALVGLGYVIYMLAEAWSAFG